MFFRAPATDLPIVESQFVERLLDDQHRFQCYFDRFKHIVQLFLLLLLGGGGGINPWVDFIQNVHFVEMSWLEMPRELLENNSVAFSMTFFVVVEINEIKTSKH